MREEYDFSNGEKNPYNENEILIEIIKDAKGICPIFSHYGSKMGSVTKVLQDLSSWIEDVIEMHLEFAKSDICIDMDNKADDLRVKIIGSVDENVDKWREVVEVVCIFTDSTIKFKISFKGLFDPDNPDITEEWMKNLDKWFKEDIINGITNNSYMRKKTMSIPEKINKTVHTVKDGMKEILKKEIPDADTSIISLVENNDTNEYKYVIDATEVYDFDVRIFCFTTLYFSDDKVMIDEFDLSDISDKQLEWVERLQQQLNDFVKRVADEYNNK